jgi:hypothetical protein
VENEERLSSHFTAFPVAADQWEKGAKAVQEEALDSVAQEVAVD